jgi:hypothetical protein
MIAPSTSQHAAEVVMVMKNTSDGIVKFRMTLGFRRPSNVNMLSEKYKYTMHFPH